MIELSKKLGYTYMLRVLFKIKSLYVDFTVFWK